MQAQRINDQKKVLQPIKMTQITPVFERPQGKSAGGGRAGEVSSVVMAASK